MKNLIISGCSISEDVTCFKSDVADNARKKNYLSYPHFINHKYKLYNMSEGGIDNGTIQRNLYKGLHIVEENNSIDIEDITVLVQWTATDRHSIYSKNLGRWLLSSRHPDDTTSEMKDYYKDEHTEEKALQNTLNIISETQLFLKSKNIKYKMFTGWNIFDNDLNLEDYDIDISDFWFFEGEHWNRFELGEASFCKYGGLNEWVKSNLDKVYWSRGPIGTNNRDLHPSNISHCAFSHGVITTILKELEIR